MKQETDGLHSIGNIIDQLVTLFISKHPFFYATLPTLEIAFAKEGISSLRNKHNALHITLEAKLSE